MINNNRSCNVIWKLHGNISRNSYGNAVVGRYGGCFQEDVWAYVQKNKRKFSDGFGCTDEVCTTLNVSRRQCTTPKRLANLDGGSAKNRSLTLVKNNSQAYCKQLAGSTLRA